VRFFFLFACYSLLYIIFIFVAALAHGGASPFPTPAGLWPGGVLYFGILDMLWWWWVVLGGGGVVA
jgi:hypothetical protein